MYYRGGVLGEAAIEEVSAGHPTEIQIGCGAVPPGVDEHLLGMLVGEERVITLAPEKAYGQHDPAKVRSYGRLMIEGGEKLQPGDWVTWTQPVTQHCFPVKVTSTTRDTVTLDFNHPFAGKTLQYWMKLVEIL